MLFTVRFRPACALALALVLGAGAATSPALQGQAPRRADGVDVPEAPVRYDTDHLPAGFHRARRDAVRAALPPSGVAVVLGGVESGGSVDDLQEFSQDPYLYYLTGTMEPGSALVLVPEGVEVDGQRVREILFVPPRNPSEEIWLGRRFGPQRARAVLGVELAVPNHRFREIVQPLLEHEDRPALLLPFPPAVAPSTELSEQMGVLAEAAQGRGGAFDDTTLTTVLDGLREVKTAEEMVLLRRAVDITAAAYREALRAVEPGWAEFEIEAAIEYTFRSMGSERPGFPSIVGSGENTVLLHYDTNRRVTRPGDLVVIDIGASYRGYTADVTRTVPVDGRFTREQRAIYEIVLEAQEEAISAVRAGASFGAPGEAASRVLARGLARLGLLLGPEDFAGLRRFFPHGTSHYLGLQVHDVGSYRALKPGMVITVEPGIYITPAEDIDPKWWNIGVRIEDDVLVTEGRPEVLSDGAPKDPDEIEAVMSELAKPRRAG
ncbi:MAG: aminopeptidase P family protein [Longimicrobiales bacterium]|nr:aminopeptidase P family protein [Longimicrobiales bacterium]